MKKIRNQKYRYYYNNLSPTEKKYYDLMYYGFIKQKHRILMLNANKYEIQKIFNFIMMDNADIYYVKKIACEMNGIGCVKDVRVEYNYSIDKVAKMIGLIDRECAYFIHQHLYDTDYEKAIAFRKLAIEICEKEWNITEGEWVDIHKREIERLLDKIRIYRT